MSRRLPARLFRVAVGSPILGATGEKELTILCGSFFSPVFLCASSRCGPDDLLCGHDHRRRGLLAFGGPGSSPLTEPGRNGRLNLISIYRFDMFA
jgi:hypothetical protein